MDSANVALVRSICSTWARGDFGSADWAHPDVEYVIADGPAATTWIGRAEMSRGARANLEAWADFRFEPEEYRELDQERVLVLHRFSGRGRTSGVEVGAMRPFGANVFHVREGQVVKLVHYWERAHALDELGLAPREPDEP